MVLSKEGDFPMVTYVTTGIVKDYGKKMLIIWELLWLQQLWIQLYNHFKDTGRTPDYYDIIATGDLGKVGKKMTLEILKEYGYDLKKLC